MRNKEVEVSGKFCWPQLATLISVCSIDGAVSVKKLFLLLTKLSQLLLLIRKLQQ